MTGRNALRARGLVVSAATTALVLLTAVLALGCGSSGDVASSESPTPAASPTSTAAAVTPQTVVDFVDKAVAYSGAHGKEAALAAYNDPDGEFRTGELYIFAYDFTGKNLAHIDPALVGKDLIGLTDPEGTPIVRNFVRIAKSGGSWYTYVWANPANGSRVEPKLAYITKVGDDWLLGAGMYLPVVGQAPSGPSPAASVSAAATEQQVVAFVEKAAAHVKAVGKKQALADFSDPNGQFREGEIYVFAEDFKGNELASGGQPELVGQSILDVQDSSGVYLVRELIATARDQARGWVGYVWDNPETAEQQEKRAYVIKAGPDWCVGSGMYVR